MTENSRRPKLRLGSFLSQPAPDLLFPSPALDYADPCHCAGRLFLEAERDQTPLWGHRRHRNAAHRSRRSLAPLARRSATPRGHDRRRRLLLSPRRVVSPRTPSRRTTPEPIVEPEPEFPNRSMQFLTRAFGPVENRQVISPVVESQLRRRHQFRIDELSN